LFALSGVAELQAVTKTPTAVSKAYTRIRVENWILISVKYRR
jgi:hypothetical protein